MKTLVTLFACVVAASVAYAEAEKAPISITKPGNETKVDERPLVEGAVSNTTAVVKVVVHPMETGDYWVQPNVSVKTDGTWKVQIYIGRPGDIDVGKHFEIMAFADPETNLEEGRVLSDWPKAKHKSGVVEVIRR